MVLLSFVLQIVAIGALRQYRVRPEDDHFGFGWEMGRIGRSIALGQGFSNPYGDSTGPTAWEPPVYPYLMGQVFKLFGIYSAASAWVLLSFNSLFMALTSIPIFFVARRTLGERLAWWPAWIWALLPYEMYWSIHWLWDTTFGPFLLACIFLVSLELQEWRGWKGWAVFGFLWGLTGLSNASLLAFLPFCGLWIWYRRHKTNLPSLPGVVLASAIFFVCVGPWMARNYRTFGHMGLIRDDFGFQLRLGNGPTADGMWMAYMQPNLNIVEFNEFRRLGEIAYEQRCRREALNWIRANPARFAVVSLKRFFYYWGGVPKPTNSAAVVDLRNSLFLAGSLLAIWGLARAVRKKIPGAGLFLCLVLSYPTLYYFVYPHARYRHPIEPELLILVVFLVSQTGRRITASRQR
jgi:4-amino-4-deoxy-L-arabinose transferase-like glycosyltransferase